MIDPEPVEVPDEAELTHVALAEPVEVVEVIGDQGDQDVIINVTADLAEDDGDDLEYTMGYLLLFGRSTQEFQHELGILARKRDASLDAQVRRAEALVEGAVEALRAELPEPDQFGP
ncbi:hypothetical protein H7J51_00120 [Mycobacterium crocinum]|uniref:DNA-binding protein n=1 Tax=Mycolicibacterium crocinum TaxID=388459 RepID=A0ABY5TUC5_9MYCO|nr:hypothetical protein [Mycolicibacterium crocinum]MCV7213690.1 hypothetical protein [Mycolicibacterium crocinum]UVY96059.1 hypothetical protein MI149_30380 [Mycolicibacterium crocinum]